MMTAQEQAEIFRIAARVVGAMDPRTQWGSPPGTTSNWTSPSYSMEQGAIWSAFGSAARVLSMIAAEFEKAAPPAQSQDRGERT